MKLVKDLKFQLDILEKEKQDLETNAAYIQESPCQVKILQIQLQIEKIQCEIEYKQERGVELTDEEKERYKMQVMEF